MTNKTTRKDNFEYLLTLVNGDERAEAFIQHELELLANRKAARKPEADENTALENAIAAAMVPGHLYLVSDLIMAVPELASRVPAPSTSFVSARMKALIGAGRVARTTQKGRSYFSLTGEVADPEEPEISEED